MPMAAVVTNIDKTKNKIIVDGTITLSGNYVANGDALDLSNLGIPSSQVPTKVVAWSTQNQAQAPLRDQYQYIPGADQSAGKLQVCSNNAEMANGAAYAATSPTNVAGYVLHFQAEFAAFI